MERQRLVTLLGAFQNLRITVFGDLFLDKWLQIDRSLDESSVETGLTAFQATSVKAAAGAAGTVLNNLKALGVGTCYAVSLLGMDGDGWEVMHALKNTGVDTRHVLRSSSRLTPVYMKPMHVSSGSQPEEGNRIDIKNHTPTPRPLEQKLIKKLHEAAAESDALIVLDQLAEENTGVVTATLRTELALLAEKHPKLLIFADSRAFIHQFKNVTIKCNHLEAERMALKTTAECFCENAVFEAMSILSKKSNRDVFVTCGAHGVAIRQEDQYCLVPAARQTGPIDVCGAGDSCTAGIVSALCAGADHWEAAFVGNLAAGITVRKLGTTGTASPAEILRLYDEQFSEGAI